MTEQFDESFKGIIGAIGASALLAAAAYGSKAIHKELNKTRAPIVMKVNSLKKAKAETNDEEIKRSLDKAIHEYEQQKHQAPKPVPVQAHQSSDSEMIGELAAMIAPYEISAPALTDLNALRKELKSHKYDRYRSPKDDGSGYQTVGIGHKIGSGSTRDAATYIQNRINKGLPLELSADEMVELFKRDATEKMQAARTYLTPAVWDRFSPKMKAAMTSLNYRGDMKAGLKPGQKYKDFVKEIIKGNYTRASKTLLAQSKSYQAAKKPGSNLKGLIPRLDNIANVIANEGKKKSK